MVLAFPWEKLPGRMGASLMSGRRVTASPTKAADDASGVAERVADAFGLSAEERDALLPSGRQRVILIDGRELADLMIEHGVGVREYRKVEFKRLDEDFFGEE